MRTEAHLVLAAALSLAACASTTGPRATLFSTEDARADVRLSHPSLSGVEDGTFDLTHLQLEQQGTDWIVTARFASRVRPLRGVRLTEDRVADVFAQTVDVYLDWDGAPGEVVALEDRGFHVPAGESWDAVLVLTSVPDVRHSRAHFPVRLVARGNALVGRFRIPEGAEAVRGVLGVVLATSPRGAGRVRKVESWRGDCAVWEHNRCTLTGQAPPVLDATVPVSSGAPLALIYAVGARPRTPRVPVVFERGKLLSAAPIRTEIVRTGGLATVFDAEGSPIATAVVLDIEGDTASLKVVGGSEQRAKASAVAFGGGVE